MSSTSDRLVYMANQIATFMSTRHDIDPSEGFAAHINDFWEPRMRRQFFEIVEAGGEGLHPLALSSAPKIRKPPPA